MRLGLIPRPAPLAAYQRARRFDIAASGIGMDVMNRLFSNDLAPLRFLRDLGLRVVDRAPSLKSLLIAEASGRAGRAEAPARAGAVSGDWSGRTLAAQALGRIDETTRALVRPIHVSSTFIRDPDNFYRAGDVYGRPDNATVREAEAVIGALEGAEATFVFGSGMSAAVALFLSLGPGARIVAPRIMYWALRAWLTNEAPDFGLRVDFVDTEDLNALERAVAEGETKLVGRLETPSNPLGVSDIEGAARIAHEAGALLAVDSTCADAGLHPPAAGARRGGCCHALGDKISERTFRRAGRRALLRPRGRALPPAAREKSRQSHGLILHPFEAFLLTRGLRTLDLRVRARPLPNALEGAGTVSQPTPAVSAVLYPGLPHHPGHQLARRQMRGGFGGMLSIRVRGGAAAAIAAAARVGLWKRATLLAAVRIVDRTSRLDRRRRLALPARSAQAFGGHRGRRGPMARYRSGACRIGGRSAKAASDHGVAGNPLQAAFKRHSPVAWLSAHVDDQGNTSAGRNGSFRSQRLELANAAVLKPFVMFFACPAERTTTCVACDLRWPPS